LYIIHYTGKFNKQAGSVPNQMVRGIEKRKAFLEMSCKNKAKPHIFIGAKSVFYIFTDYSRIRLFSGLHNFFNVLVRHDDCAEAIQT